MGDKKNNLVFDQSRVDETNSKISRLRVILEEASKQPSLRKMVGVMSGVLDDVDTLLLEAIDRHQQIDIHLATLEKLLEDTLPASGSQSSKSTVPTSVEGDGIQEVAVSVFAMEQILRNSLREVPVENGRSGSFRCGEAVRLVVELKGEVLDHFIMVRALHFVHDDGVDNLVFVYPLVPAAGSEVKVSGVGGSGGEG